MKKPDEDQFSPDETKQRLRAILRGAAAGRGTPLKEIPRKRALRQAQAATKRPRKTA
jgi:hypothetical protein